MAQQIGDEWGAFKLSDIYTESVSTTHNGITDIIPTRFMVLDCSCGKRKTIAAGSFPGRRKMRDCGCGSSIPMGGKITAAYVPDETLKRIKTYASEQGLTVSKAITILCETALRSKAGRG
jgi:hypothetical protein